jgi:Gpi18-like mannosyltransferase
LRKILIRIFIICTLARIVYLLSGSVYYHYEGYNKSSGLHIFNKADAGWYQNIFIEGYPHVSERDSIGLRNGANSVQSSWAFFPGYPYTIKLVAEIFHCNYNRSAFIAGFFFSLTFFFLLIIFLKNENRLRANWIILLTIACFPFHFFYHVFYSEAYFMAAMLAAMLLIQKKYFFTAAICLALMVMIRSSGLSLLPVIFFYALHTAGFSSLSQFKKMWTEVLKHWIKYLLLLLIPFFVFACWCYYQFLSTGHWNAFAIAQEGWYHKLRFPLLSLFRGGDWQNQFLSWYTVLFLVAAVIFFKKFLLYEKIWVVIGLLFPLCFGSVISMPRYISIVLPIFFVAGEKISRTKYSSVILSFFALLQLVTFYFWLKGDPICF